MLETSRVRAEFEEFRSFLKSFRWGRGGGRERSFAGDEEEDEESSADYEEKLSRLERAESRWTCSERGHARIRLPRGVLRGELSGVRHGEVRGLASSTAALK